MWLLLMQTGQTFTEHASDVYPMLMWLIIALLTIIGSMMVAYIKQNKSDMEELKVGQLAFMKLLSDHTINEERTFGRLDARVSVIEDRIGIRNPREIEAD